jgi:hypothetical protein
MTDQNLSLAVLARECGSHVVEAKSYEDKRQASLEAANTVISKLHSEKAIVGTKGKCAVATAFYDALVTGGLAKGTASNYLSVFRDAVKTGKKVTEWNPSQSKGKGKGKKTKGSKAFVDLLRVAFNHSEGKTFEALCGGIQAQYEDAQIDSLYQGFVEYFKSEGDDIAE